MNRIINLTNINRSIMSNRKIEYIVMHYVGAVSTAENNGKYFKKVNRGASAHYFVDDNNCVQIVEDKNASWHCGTKKGYYNECRNSNSIGIEMCCFNNNGKLDITEQTENNAIELVKELMQKYNITVDRVIRHYDVTHKICPAPFVENIDRWNNFKNKLGKIQEENSTVTKTQEQKGQNVTVFVKNSRVGNWQSNMNKSFNCGLSVDNCFGNDSKAKANKYLIKKGSINAVVGFIQSRLNELGFNCGVVDNVFGMKTLNAVRQFQKSRGLVVDGIVGANTTIALLK